MSKSEDDIVCMSKRAYDEICKHLIEKGISLSKSTYNELLTKKRQFAQMVGRGQRNMEEKPPLGVIPERIHDEQRMNALGQAIARYTEVGKLIPRPWIDELETLNEKMITHDEQKTTT